MIRFLRQEWPTLLVVAAICAVILGGARLIDQENTEWRQERDRDCAEQGGVVAEQRGDDFCIRDGLIIKVYK